ncbi:MAG: trypsin-like peptidase domain-containing protein [Candidatus Bathyarchaeota archaeon]|nr:trypsin-like peptidase domain-containing protein [Candidatus Bathyarchaeota archaeon]MCX8177683.1 trypsin-like peptidase domain-containing protein [Candidatus Bathyarchaeota archaeon]MDW8193943.1 trypsin-like peptidase domain-containing protein [Nitrososphaerota archaeon]
MYTQQIPRGFLALLFIAGLVIGGVASLYVSLQQIKSLETDVSELRSQVSKLWGSQDILYQNFTVYHNGTSLSELYEKVKDSVVLVSVKKRSGSFAKGSGFIYNFTGKMIIVTNYHVVHEAVNISITFRDGEGYRADILGKDPYADLAVLSVEENVPKDKFKPLRVVSSSTLKVGDPVIAIGNPYGLVGSMTTGVISALGRTITEDYTGGFAIANVIQTSAPINPGNSGGPLLNLNGEVVGITTAIVSDSQGLGFAIPSNTLLKEIYALATTGEYRGHSYMGIKGEDMDYYVAKELGAGITYGWLVREVVNGGPSHGKLQVNDIIVAINGTRIRNGDDLASYMEEKTLPGNTIKVTVMRKTGNTWKEKIVEIILGERPSPPI